jgi:chromosome partitioning protein
LVRDVRENLDVIISDKNLARAEQALVSMPRREEILSFRLRGLVDYDYVIIDCAPSLSQMHHNALLYADELVIPISMDYLALMGSSQIFESIKMIRDLWEKDLRVAGILPTFVNRQQAITREILEAIELAYGQYGQRIFPGIRQDMNLKKCIASHETIFDFLKIGNVGQIRDSHRAAWDYYQVTQLIVGENHEHVERSKEEYDSVRRGFAGDSARNVADA